MPTPTSPFLAQGEMVSFQELLASTLGVFRDLPDGASFPLAQTAAPLLTRGKSDRHDQLVEIAAQGLASV
jgi:hypothetical protein